MQCGNEKTDELTFEQPEEIAFFKAKVKPDGAAVIRNRAGRNFCAKESGTAGDFSRLSFFRKTGFFYFRKNSQKLFQHKLEEPKNERL